MSVISMRQLLGAGVHFGHQTRRWNPKMAPYIYTERNGIHIIDLQTSVGKVDEAYQAVSEIAAAGGTILFVGTKKQAQEAVKTEAERCGMYYVNERWLGGMLTNFKTIQTRIATLKKYETDNRNPKLEQLSKIADALEVSVFEFLDIEVKSINDIISLVNKMNIATDIDWDIDNDKVCISFKNKEINNCLKDYAVDYKKDNILIEKTETNYESTLTRLMLINDKLR